MRRAVIALAVAAATVLGFVVFDIGNAQAWKCDKHPEQPTCTTTTPPENSTTSRPPVSVSQPNPSTSLPTTTTSVPPEVPPTVPPEVSLDPPSIIRLAG